MSRRRHNHTVVRSSSAQHAHSVVVRYRAQPPLTRVPLVTARMLPGAPVADAVYADLMPRIVSLVKAGHQPGLGTILVGDDSASAGYIRMKQEKAQSLGFSSPHIALPADCTQVDLVDAIRTMNDDKTVDGIDRKSTRLNSS